MSWLSNIFSGSAGGIIKGIGDIVDEWKISPEEKAEFSLRLEELLQKRDSEIEQTIRTRDQAKERVLVAELKQDDAYTKRARPTVVYAGLVLIFWNYALVPLLSAFGVGVEVVEGVRTALLQPLSLPSEFWLAWGGIVSTWVIGRSAEKRGASNRAVEAITGNKAGGRLTGFEM